MSNSDFVERLKKELSELRTKLDALGAFITRNPIFATLEGYDQNLMREQLAAMIVYEDVLRRRYDRFTLPQS